MAYIGHHLVSYLVAKGTVEYLVPTRSSRNTARRIPDFLIADLRESKNYLAAAEGVDDIYHLAADMGGIGFITASMP